MPDMRILVTKWYHPVLLPPFLSYLPPKYPPPSHHRIRTEPTPAAARSTIANPALIIPTQVPKNYLPARDWAHLQPIATISSLARPNREVLYDISQLDGRPPAPAEMRRLIRT